MKKKYFVILNSIAVAKESSLVDAVRIADSIRQSFCSDESEAINYQTVYTNIKKVSFYIKNIPVKIADNFQDSIMYLTIQEIDI